MAAAQPPNLITRLDITTSHGTLNVTTSLPMSPPPQPNRDIETPTLLLIHGNSSSSQIFTPLFFPPPPSAFSTPVPTIAATHRLIAFDLPGHGASTDAPPGPCTPYSSHYTMPAYAAAALAVLNHLHVSSAIVFGHSLGGHIGIELIPRLGRRLKGLMLTGTPPVPRGEPHIGFKMRDGHLGAAEAEVLSEEEAEAFAEAAAGVQFGKAFSFFLTHCGSKQVLCVHGPSLTPVKLGYSDGAPLIVEALLTCSFLGGKCEPWILAAVKRTDGRARKEMWSAFRKGEGVDQKETVEREKRVLLAVVNGADEPFVDLEYCATVKYGNLWSEECLKLKGLGHTPFWENWSAFEGVLRRFVDDVTEEAQ